ncbi:arsenite efflux transporter metallochaperone ArsD [Salinigranum halophilum]|uniref:arsenite efflux transporter metallochaperone ArsD n=1 Tax=Salinigranum halophilum TaxID=2565931 RepID=UPI0010A7BE8B|nr:arsenite efflux transporter metallochaperone ArsD [Salinigranum halophilum]
MTELTLYEEAMCCSTGVCGPDPDDELVELSAALDQLEDEFENADISRANMQHNIDDFLDTAVIYDLVQENGPEVLPITVVDGEIVAKEQYLSYDEMAAELRGREAQEA